MKSRAIAVGLVAVMASGTTAQAGFLDWLFGSRKPAAPVGAAAQPVSVTIHPSRRVASKPKAKTPSIVQLSPQEMMARTIDPVANPDWWLMDPTLRKGDILVLSDRVMVFAGGRVGVAANYAALENSRLVSKTERRQIAMMASIRYEPPMLTAAAAPKQPQLLRQAAAVMPPLLGAPGQPSGTRRGS